MTLPAPGTPLIYTVAAHRAAYMDRVQHLLPRTVPLGFRVFEMQTLGSEPVSWAGRWALDQTRDLVLEITSEYLVKSAYVQHAHHHQPRLVEAGSRA